MPEESERSVLAFAAGELDRWLLRAGVGRDWMPSASVTVDRGLTYDTYTYEADERLIRITGSDPGTALIGVYAYLKAVGFAFYAPGDDYTVVPHLTAPEQLAAGPAASTARYPVRGVCVEGADSLDHLLSYIDWLPKAGMNTMFLQFFRPDVFFERWYSHTLNPSLPGIRLTDSELDAFDMKAAREAAHRGLKLHRAGHGWTSRALHSRGNGWQRENEPEDGTLRDRIALVNGRRALFNGVPANTNLCYAREDVRRELTDLAVRYAREHLDTDVIHFWLADTYNNVCECERCRQTTLSDQYVEILNLIDEAFEREKLTTRVVFLLYQELLYPPKKARIKNEDRFILMFAPISRTFERPYPGTAQPGELPPYRRNRMTLPLSIEENLRYYAAWRKVYGGRAFVYDYHLGRAHYGDPGYLKIAGTLFEDLETMKALGFDGLISCQELRVMMPNAFPIWLMGRALWEEGLSFEALKKEYFAGLYGAQAAGAQRYFEQVSALCDTDYANRNGPRHREDLTGRYREIARLSRSEAERTEDRGDPIPAKYLSTLQQNALYADAVAYLTEGRDAEAADAFRRFKALIRAREAVYPDDYDVYRAIEVMTRYTGLDPMTKDARGDE